MYFGSQDMKQLGRPRAKLRDRGRRLFLHWTVHTDSEVHAASYSTCNDTLSRYQSNRDNEWVGIYLHYLFKAHITTTFLLLYKNIKHNIILLRQYFVLSTKKGRMVHLLHGV